MQNRNFEKAIKRELLVVINGSLGVIYQSYFFKVKFHVNFLNNTILK